MKTLICKLLGHKWETEEHIFCKRCGLIQIEVPEGIDSKELEEYIEKSITRLKE